MMNARVSRRIFQKNLLLHDISRRFYRHSSFWSKQLQGLFYTEVVTNTGSIARDVLAAERTFLAWSRTGLGFVGAGSAMFAAYQRYGNFDRESNDKRVFILQPVFAASALLVGNGAFLLLFATRRYLRIIHALTKDQFPIDTKGPLLAVVVTASSTITSLGLLLQDEYQNCFKSREKKEKFST